MTPAELRGLRTRLGWSRERAAGQIGISPRALAYYEDGVNSRGTTLIAVPRPVALAMLAVHFAIEVGAETGTVATPSEGEFYTASEVEKL